MPQVRLKDEAGGLLIAMPPAAAAASASGRQPAALDSLRRAAAFHNTVDVWVGACAEAGRPWEDGGRYGRFVEHLRAEGVPLRPFQLCVSDEEGGGDHERAKAAFARAAREGSGDAAGGGGPPGVHSVRLNDRAVAAARGFVGGGDSGDDDGAG